MYYIGIIEGKFKETQKIEAKNEKEAKKLFEENAGETLERTATGNLTVSNIEEVSN